jgi:hypothetical protein
MGVSLAVATLGGAAAVAPERAEAVSYPTTVLNVSSTDGNAHGKATITWMSATHIKASMENCDRRADGRGAILHLLYLNSLQLGYTVSYDHVLAGNGSCDYFSADFRASGDDIWGVQLRECNGGSRSDEQRCELVESRNKVNGG